MEEDEGDQQQDPPTLDASKDELGSGDAGSAMDAGDGLQSVTIRFKAKLGSQELVCGQRYADQGSTRVDATPQDFRFLVQEVRLLRKGSAQEERVQFDVRPPFQRPEIALIDFTDAAGNCGSSGGSILNTEIRGRVAVGEYDGVVFINGVPEQLNHAGPAETAAPPLDDISLFWNWQGGYRFIVAELLPVAIVAPDAGPADAATGVAHDAGTPLEAGAEAGVAEGMHAAPDGGSHGALQAAFVHVGNTGCSGTEKTGFTCVRQARNEVRLHGFDPARNVLVADLAEIFKTSDLRTPLQCHGIAAPCAAPYAALGIDMASGNPAPTQQVFRVE